MIQVKDLIKLLFTSLNIIFVIVGAVIIIVTLVLLSPSFNGLRGGDDVRQTHPLTPDTHTHGANQPIDSLIQCDGHTTTHIVLYVIGSVTMVIAILGAYGGHKENLVALTVYQMCMVIGGLLVLRAGVSAAVIHPKPKSVMEDRWRSLLPLDQASDNIKVQVEALQTSLHCCGLFSHEDWGQNIPDSCLCNQEEQMEGKCQTISYRNFLLNLFWQKKSVFTQTCFPLIMDSVTTNTDVTLGVDATLFVLALLGLVLSSLVIYQIFNTANRSNTLSVPVMFTNQPPDYQQLYNITE
ncbi:tetraspanin-8-like isoform X1 [Thunnus thynnus]|uniref:tetraspanin-8-like isoform X1 n=1 Tax=Thunnus maccoyii TaxID=8240 RepID=UPI001C4C6F37|nr:tetraspanin-8-like isoform X1 [Thunnus maccoyii]XP_042259758.1 tetraspanin-8-like isoform X1 [Thunnus maccoyii]XP_042259759.1 tetraspanin-8-like isoform X1 [Thunnus maccoyii]XP_042259760.1 tetraspanin-8-like isoform X1 [Thunnus maccoyii]